MNHDDVAQKIANGISNAEMLPTLHANSVREIAAALRRAANEAAWDGFCTCMCQVKEHEAEDYLENRIASKYGPRPEGGTR